METVLANLGVSLAFGVLGIALAILGFKVFEWVTPKVDVEKELGENKNMAVAVVCAALILGICYVVTHVVTGDSK